MSAQDKGSMVRDSLESKDNNYDTSYIAIQIGSAGEVAIVR